MERHYLTIFEIVIRKAFKRLQCLTMHTRPGLSFIANKLSKFGTKLSERILFLVTALSERRNNLTSLCIMPGDVVVYCKIKKQQVVATSTMEVKYIGIYPTCKLVVWILQRLD